MSYQQPSLLRQIAAGALIALLSPLLAVWALYVVLFCGEDDLYNGVE